MTRPRPRRIPAPRPGARAALILLALCGCAGLPPQESVKIGSTQIAYVRTGNAPVTAVFQSGLGDGKAVWAAVVDRVAPPVAVFAYDRPGYGSSPATTGPPRDPCTIARELREILRATGIEPPYVLVGHSLGGLYQYAFAKLYPDDVAAVLLLDPTHPDHWATLQQRAPGPAALVTGLRSTVFTGAMRAEFDDQAGCLPRLRALRTRPVPTRILVRSRFEALESGAFEAMIRDLEAQWLVLLPGAARRQVDGARHYIQKDRPGVVADELRALVAQAQGGRM